MAQDDPSKTLITMLEQNDRTRNLNNISVVDQRRLKQKGEGHAYPTNTIPTHKNNINPPIREQTKQPDLSNTAHSRINFAVGFLMQTTQPLDLICAFFDIVGDVELD